MSEDAAAGGVELEPFPLEGPRPAGLLDRLAQHPTLAQPWQRFANQLLTDGALPPRWREIVVLRVAWRRRCRYVLRGHAAIALHCGVSPHELNMVGQGAAASGWRPVEAALLAATDDLLDQGQVSATTRAVMARALDHRQLVELPMLVGQYVLITMVVGFFEIPPEDGLPDPAETGSEPFGPANPFHLGLTSGTR